MTRIENLMASLPQSVECCLITSDINRRYFTGMKSSAGIVVCFRECSYLLIDFRYIEKARNVVKNCEVIELTSLASQLQELISKHKVKKISVEAREMSLQTLNSYEKVLPNVEFDTSDTLSKAIYDMRTIKDKFELDKISQAQGIAEKAFFNITRFIKVGMTEREIALELDYLMLKNGAEALSFDTIVLAGRNTSMPHGVPSDYKVQNGDFVLMDFGAVYDGYHSDMTRTVCVGRPTQEMKKVYGIILEAQRTAIEAVREGISGKELDKIARDIITEAGYGKAFGHSLGHGVGMEIHEFPNASPKSTDILKENMVVTVEPGIYIPGRFGVRIEDFVTVKPAGYRNFTKCPKNLIVL